MKTNPIIAFVGPSGSGKSTLILHLYDVFPELRIMRSLTTRKRREPNDDHFYKFVPRIGFKLRRFMGSFVQWSEYAGNFYGNSRYEVNRLLKKKVGITALTEEGVIKFRRAGYHVIVIRVETNADTSRDNALRANADHTRARIQIATDIVINNSFASGGLERSIAQVEEFVRRTLAR